MQPKTHKGTNKVIKVTLFKSGIGVWYNSEDIS